MRLRKPEDVIIRNTTLKDILEKESMDSDLLGADLSYVDLSYTDLSYAKLRGANLSHSNLLGACLCNADLFYADISYADLRNSNLSYCDLQYASLEGTNLSYSDLRNANLQNANLVGTNLFRAIGDHFEYRRGKMLTESIIGYKVCKTQEDGMPVIVTLEIPKGAIVFSINEKKCRTNKAKVLSIGNGHVIDRAYSILRYMTYYVGDEFTVYNFNCEYNVECAEGIHFFMTKEDAIFFACRFRSRK